MPITDIWELKGSQRAKLGKNPSVQKRYRLEGDSNLSQVKLYLNTVLASYSEGLRLDSANVREVSGRSDQWDADVTWKGVADKQNPLTPKDRNFSMTIGSTTANRKYAIATPGKYAVSGNAPDINNAINKQGQEIKGLDVPVPDTSFSEDYEIDLTDLTEVRIKGWMKNRFKTNQDTFRTFDPGEVLFLGALIKYDGLDTADIAFNFDYSENVTNHTVGPINGITKKGWDYLWPEYELVEENDQTLQKIKYVYVNQIFEEMNFATELGI